MALQNYPLLQVQSPNGTSVTNGPSADRAVVALVVAIAFVLLAWHGSIPPEAIAAVLRLTVRLPP